MAGAQVKKVSLYANYYSNNGGTIRVQVLGVDNQKYFLWQLGPNCCWSSVWT